MDDVVIFGRTFDEHLARLDAVLSSIEEAGLVLNLEKCRFCIPELPYLGHILSYEGLNPDSRNTKAIENFPTPTDIASLRSFLGAVGYYRRFVPDFARWERPLGTLLRKNVLWHWSPDCEVVFTKRKRAVVSPPVLKDFDPEAEAILRTDASGTGLGTVLSQREGDIERPVLYLSRRLSDIESRYHTNE